MNFRLFQYPGHIYFTFVLVIGLMKNRIKDFATKLLLLLVALQVLNFSMDTIDFHPHKHRNTISDFNYLNSVVEYFDEIILGNKDAFPEYSKHNAKESQNIKHFDVKICQQVPFKLIPDHYIIQDTPYNNKSEFYSLMVIKEIIPPPPKVV
jgi:hypothetical protein